MTDLIIAFFLSINPTTFRQKTIIPTDQTLIQEGKRIYVSNCARCHNTNPHKPGSIGPDLFSTPENVFYTKVVHGKYPQGYKPKRPTKVMPKFKHLTNKIDMIYKYIRSIPI
jgi:mono/diheme cytochrome c family protein